MIIMDESCKIHKYKERIKCKLDAIRSHQYCSEVNADFLFAEGLSVMRICEVLEALVQD